ncbi:transposase family protein [Streptomyces umbrinus]|uniref:transposase family protein n=1 Tax=Streptomyces umbrinus TaxID=67370 RepID=UPI0033E4BFB7
MRALADPRCRRGKSHPFVVVLLIACSAMVSGATSFVAIGEWTGGLGCRTRIPAQKAPFDSHGQVVFSNGKNYITPDLDG